MSRQPDLGPLYRPLSPERVYLSHVFVAVVSEVQVVRCRYLIPSVVVVVGICGEYPEAP